MTAHADSRPEPVEVTCPDCGYLLRTRVRGRGAKCTACGRVFYIRRAGDTRPGGGPKRPADHSGTAVPVPVEPQQDRPASQPAEPRPARRPRVRRGLVVPGQNKRPGRDNPDPPSSLYPGAPF